MLQMKRQYIKRLKSKQGKGAIFKRCPKLKKKKKKKAWTNAKNKWQWKDRGDTEWGNKCWWNWSGQNIAANLKKQETNKDKECEERHDKEA